MTPILVQLSPKRYIFVWLRASGITGGSVGCIDWLWADIAFGPNTYEACMEWLKKESQQ